MADVPTNNKVVEIFTNTAPYACCNKQTHLFNFCNCSPVIPAGIAGIQLPGRVKGDCHPRLPSTALDSRQSMARMTQGE
jgi:hypothetical protein